MWLLCDFFIQSYRGLCVESVAAPFEAVSLVSETHLFEWSEEHLRNEEDRRTETPSSSCPVLLLQFRPNHTPYTVSIASVFI